MTDDVKITQATCSFCGFIITFDGIENIPMACPQCKRQCVAAYPQLVDLKWAEDRMTFVISVDNSKDAEVRDVFLWDEKGRPIIKRMKMFPSGIKQVQRITYIVDRDVGFRIKKIRAFDSYRVLFNDGDKPLLYTRDDFIKHLGIRRYSDVMTQALDALPMNAESVQKPLILYDGDYLRLVDLTTVISENRYVELLMPMFAICKDKEKLRKNFELLMDLVTPKQRTYIAAIAGTLTYNLLREKYRWQEIKKHVLGVGDKDTGKSGVAIAAELVLFGVDMRGKPFNGTNTESKFRFDMLSDATNIPLVVDDALVNASILDAIRAKSGGGTSERGTSGQRLNVTENLGTFVLTSNEEVYDENHRKNEADLKRFLTVPFGYEDRIQPGEFHKFQTVVEKLDCGGYYYDVMSDKKLDEVRDLYKLIQRKTGDQDKAMVLLGATLLNMDKWVVDLDCLGQGVGEDWRRLFYESTMGLMSKAEDGRAWDYKDKIAQVEEGEFGKDGVKYLLISSAYLDYYNKGRPRYPVWNLRDLRAFAELTDQKPWEIYAGSHDVHAETRATINGRQTRVAKIRVTDIRFYDNDKNTKNADDDRSAGASRGLSWGLDGGYLGGYFIILNKLTKNNILASKTGDISSYRENVHIEIEKIGGFGALGLNSTTNTLASEKEQKDASGLKATSGLENLSKTAEIAQNGTDHPFIKFLKDKGGRATKAEWEAQFGPGTWLNAKFRQVEGSGDIYIPKTDIVALSPSLTRSSEDNA